MILSVDLGPRSYEAVIERGCLHRASSLLNLDRKVLVVTDSGVPEDYAKTLLGQCKEGYLFTFPQGEESKNLEVWTAILSLLTEKSFTRTDCVVAVGGGVSGDMAGFAAAVYLRGIDFYNIPTTLLAQIDSSVGGKVAVDFRGYKNIVGTFHQPKKVLVDPDVLATLDPRQVSAGMAEAVKMAVIGDEELFEIFEQGKAYESLEQVIYRSLAAKAKVVQADEREGGLRKILNFGHTLGHAVETVSGYTLLHGECVALGMIPMASPAVRARLLPVLQSLNLPVSYEGDGEKIISAMAHDKKCSGGTITGVYCEKIGTCALKTLDFAEFSAQIREVL